MQRSINRKRFIMIMTSSPEHGLCIRKDISEPNNESDIFCGRGKGNYNRSGNIKLRSLVREHIPQYMSSKSRQDKVLLFTTIIHKMRSNHNGRFLKKLKDGQWSELSTHDAQEKVRHIMETSVASFQTLARKAGPFSAEQTLLERIETKRLQNNRARLAKQIELLELQKAHFQHDVLLQINNTTAAESPMKKIILKQRELQTLQKAIFAKMMGYRQTNSVGAAGAVQVRCMTSATSYIVLGESSAQPASET